MRALVVIPAHNERATIARVVTAVVTQAPVLVVDDGSTDGTAAAARAGAAAVIRHPWRRGKGEALRTGIAEARRRGASHVVTMDADGQHRAEDLPRVLAAARRSPGAIVVGGRLAGADWRGSRVRWLAIQLTGWAVRALSGLGVRDTQSGFRAYPVALFDAVVVRSGGFVFETEVLLAAAAAGFPVEEIPIVAAPRAGRPSRFRPLADGGAIGLHLAHRALAAVLAARGDLPVARPASPPGSR
jgi:glycosyltransferase involved in cell wall biosynthesis